MLNKYFSINKKIIALYDNNFVSEWAPCPYRRLTRPQEDSLSIIWRE